MPTSREITQELARSAGIRVPYYRTEVVGPSVVRFWLYGGRIVDVQVSGDTAEIVEDGNGSAGAEPDPQPVGAATVPESSGVRERSLDIMRKGELLALAGRRGIVGRSRMTKAQLISALCRGGS